MIVAFVDELRAEGHAVESICRVLREQGVQVAARTYRAWAQPSRRVAARVVSDAIVVDKIRDLAWTVDEQTGVRKMTPEGLYGRPKMTALLRRNGYRTLVRVEVVGPDGGRRRRRRRSPPHYGFRDHRSPLCSRNSTTRPWQAGRWPA